ncbi:MAG: BMP family lipoprotein [Actinomycetes bacterium]
MRSSVKIAAAVGVLALTAAACGSKPATSTPSSSSSATSAAPASFKACMVTDTGGIDDRSFNASAWQGIQNAESALGVSGQYLQSTSQNDYTPNINALVGQKCGVIVTVGFLMGDATKAAATANPNQKFAIVDFSYTPTMPNVLGLTYNTAQAGFLGGYLAAGMTKTGKVATFGGMKIPPVTIYMDGYWDGVKYYNAQHKTNVQVLGWNETTQNGTFTGDFTDQAKGQQVTQTFIQQGADIIFPVAGNVGLGAAKAAQQSNGKANLLWVDTDGCVSAPQYCSLFISSVTKGIAVSVQGAVKAAKDGTFQGGAYVGTLANNGVGLAPFHDWASKVPATLQSELAQVKAGIIAGTIKVTSPSQPSSS